jgi:hypothetical protein
VAEDGAEVSGTATRAAACDAGPPPITAPRPPRDFLRCQALGVTARSRSFVTTWRLRDFQSFTFSLCPPYSCF